MPALINKETTKEKSCASGQSAFCGELRHVKRPFLDTEFDTALKGMKYEIYGSKSSLIFGYVLSLTQLKVRSF